MYVGAHLTYEYQCGVKGYNKRKRKLYIYIIAQYHNCQGNYQTSLVQYPLRLKAQIQARKDKASRISESPKNARSAMREIRKEKSSITSDLNMDIEGEKQAKGPIKEPSLKFGPKCRDHTQDCSC